MADLGERPGGLIFGKKEEMAEGRKEQVNHNRPPPQPPSSRSESANGKTAILGELLTGSLPRIHSSLFPPGSTGRKSNLTKSL